VGGLFREISAITEAIDKKCSKRWIVDRATLRQARADDLLYIDDPEHLDFLAIYFAERELSDFLDQRIEILPSCSSAR
jgi:hypothetical protein